MKKEWKRKLLKAKLLNYVTAFAEELNRCHPETKSKFNVGEAKDFLLDDYLDTFIGDILDIKKAYEAKDDGKTLEHLWNGSYNYNIDEEEK
jgi:hypothetical protein|tara:strand:- start:88 stop:360 length:273 start_codon:yes stop_codon:yes gene_type:complete